MSDERYISPHPKPAPHEAELLIILAEECAEVIKNVTKLLRFGAADIDPNAGDSLTNDRRLAMEIGDVFEVVSCLLEAKVITNGDIELGERRKHEKLERFLQNRPPDK